MKVMYCLLAILLAGCASNSGVVPIGQDTFMVSRQAATGFSGLGDLKGETFREAHQYCLDQRKSLQVLHASESSPPYIFGNFPKAVVQFRCLDQNDSERARQKLRNESDTLVDRSRHSERTTAGQTLPRQPSPTNKLTPLESDVDRVSVTIPATSRSAHAVVIGIEQYRQKLPMAEFATHDAEVVRDYLSKMMGVPEENIALLINERATKTDIEKYVEGWLPNRVEAGDTVFVYFSGHGAPNPRTGKAFLVPYDGDPVFVEQTAYSLERLYEKLAALPAKEVVVVLDSCFSGAGGRSVIAKGMRPIVTEVTNPMLAKGKAVVLAASTGQQVSSTYEEKAHGLLTYFFLKGLQGEGDTNRDGTIELTELFYYLKPQVERVARREFNNEQTPQLLGSSVVLNRGVRLADRAGQ